MNNEILNTGFAVHVNENRQKVFSFLSEREANEVTDCLEKQVVPRIKKALEAMIRKKKKEKFTVI